MEFRPLTTEESKELGEALRRNAASGEALRMNPRDTTFLATSEADDSIEAMISQIKSIPCHYGDLTDRALGMIRESERYRQDAREGAPVGNSVIGSLLAIETGSPRRNTEAAVAEALCIYDAEQSTARRIKRTGLAPLVFSGHVIAEQSGDYQNGREQNRWHDLTLYVTDTGKHVIVVEYQTRWQGESGHTTAQVVDTPVNLADFLQTYDPIGMVQGFPPGQAYAERQSRLANDLRIRYEQRVGNLLAEAGDEFAENI